MTIPNWQLQHPINALVFDCDGTLSLLEGVNELAKEKGVDEAVSALTEKAMSKTGINPALYEERLNLITPQQTEVLALGNRYYKTLVHGASDVIKILQRLQKSVYLVSAGLLPAIFQLGTHLTIPKENIFAVDITFDKHGNFIDFDRNSPLVQHDGKRKIVSALKQKHEHVIHIGDGLNDYVVHDIVTRFIGFGGAFFRENLSNLCKYYISTASLLPLLPLVLTGEEVTTLSVHEAACYQQGLDAILKGEVKL